MGSRVQGLRLWLLQRLSALYMAIYVVIALAWLVSNKPVDFVSWQGVFAQPVINIITQLFIYLLLAHAWIGMRDIIIDYVYHTASRFILLTLISLFQLVLAMWVFMAFYAVVRL